MRTGCRSMGGVFSRVFPRAKSGRESGIELLRIFAMLIIVGNHFATHSGLNLNVMPSEKPGNFFFMQMLACGGKFGVDLFVLITGYFHSTGGMKGVRLVGLWLTTVLYGIGIWCATHFAFGVNGNAIHSLFPLVHNSYWFITAYFCMELLSPYLARMMDAMTRREHLLLCATLLVLYSIIPSILVFPGSAGRNLFYYSYTLWFVVLFIVAGYIRRYVDFRNVKAIWLASGAVAGAAAIAIYIYACDMAVAGGAKGWVWSVWRNENSAPLLFLCICLFGLFARLRIGAIPFINAVASCMLGVYLLHDHAMVRRLLWRKPSVFAASVHYGQPWFPLKALGCVLAVFISAALAAFVINKLISPIVRFVCNAAERRTANWLAWREE